MTFWSRVAHVLSRTFNYSGRAERVEFWWWMRLLFCVLLVWFVAMVAIDMLIVRSGLDLGSLVLAQLVDVGILVAVMGFLPTLALTVRRVHDTGRSGKVVLAWFLLPLFAWIVFLGIAFVTIGFALVYGGASAVPTYISLGIAVAVTLAVAGWAIWWLQQDGDDGPNQFGDVPR